jgi:hypothetical protein
MNSHRPTIFSEFLFFVQHPLHSVENLNAPPEIKIDQIALISEFESCEVPGLDRECRMKVVPNPMIRDQASEGLISQINIRTENDSVPSIRDVTIIHTELC